MHHSARNSTTWLLLLLAAGASAATSGSAPLPTEPLREESVTYRNDQLQLAAALLLPATAGRVPGAVILQGSGDSDRTNAWARSIAEALARRGIAVLLTDKRGCGGSQGDWHEADFEDLAEDAIAGARYLRGRAEVDPAAVGYLGLSQGGQVTPYAASLDLQSAFAIAVSSSATTLAEQMHHEMRNTLRQAGLPAAGVAAGMEIQELAERYVRAGDWEAYAEALAAAAKSDLAPVAAGFPQTPDSWVWAWVRRVADYDPVPRWQQVTAPILVVYGRDDEHDNVPVAESVRRLEESLRGRRAPHEIRVYEGSGHALYEPGGERPVVRADALDRIAATILRRSG